MLACVGEFPECMFLSLSSEGTKGLPVFHSQCHPCVLDYVLLVGVVLLVYVESSVERWASFSLLWTIQG